MGNDVRQSLTILVVVVSSITLVGFTWRTWWDSVGSDPFANHIVAPSASDYQQAIEDEVRRQLEQQFKQMSVELPMVAPSTRVTVTANATTATGALTNAPTNTPTNAPTNAPTNTTKRGVGPVLSKVFAFPAWLTGTSLLFATEHDADTGILQASVLEFGISQENWLRHRKSMVAVLEGMGLRQSHKSEHHFSHQNLQVSFLAMQLSRKEFNFIKTPPGQGIDYATFTDLQNKSFLIYDFSGDFHSSIPRGSDKSSNKMNLPGKSISETRRYVQNMCGRNCVKQWNSLKLADRGLFANWDNPFVPCDEAAAEKYLNAAGIQRQERCVYFIHRGMEVLTHAGIRPFLCHGMLLSYSRQCSCIPTTGDMDMCLLAEEFTSMKHLKKIFQEHKMGFEDTHAIQNPLIFKTKHLGMDLDFKVVNSHPTENWMFNGIPMSKNTMSFFVIPRIPSFVWSTMHGYPVRVPSNHVAVVSAYYGPTWNQLEVWEGTKAAWKYRNQIGYRHAWQGRTSEEIRGPPASYWPEFEKGRLKINPKGQPYKYEELPFNPVLPIRFQNETSWACIQGC